LILKILTLKDKEYIMKKSIMRIAISVTIFAAVAAFLLAGCENGESPNNNRSVDGFLVRVNGDTSDVYIDTRDGKRYRTVRIGGVKWMAENMNYKTSSGSWCYDNNESNCMKYGRLYTWKAARTACPPVGWKLPDKQDWDNLQMSVEKWNNAAMAFDSSAGKRLKSTFGWDDYKGESGNGTDEYGFSALPGGACCVNTPRDSVLLYEDGFTELPGGGSYGVGFESVWWTATEEYSPSPCWWLEVQGVDCNERFAYFRAVSNQNDRLGESAGSAIVNSWKFSVRCVEGKDTTGIVDPKTVVKGTFIDNRDGQKYNTVTIGKQTWMAQNLNYATERGSWCYDNNGSNCNQYGRLYNWNTAMGGKATSNNNPSGVQGVCPNMWHLPSVAEWRVLVDYSVGGYSTAGKALKAASGWNSGGNGTNTYGFSAIPGGYYRSGGFFNAGYHAHWWTTTQSIGVDAYYRGMYDYDTKVYESGDGKGNGFSVRCVKD
jgi:uncharacterized protein (TIGR02145 family)